MFGWIRNLFSGEMQRGLNLDNPANWSSIGYDDLELPTAAGIPVSAGNAMSLSTINKAVRLISNDLAEMNWCPYRRINGGKEELTNHRGYYLLNIKPNGNTSGFDFKRSLIRDLLLEGNGYAFISRLAGGMLDEFLYLPAARVIPKKNEDGDVVYEVMMIQSGGAQYKRLFPAEEILHIKGLGDELKGASLIHQGKDNIALGIAMQKYQASFFKNAVTMPGYIKHPGKLKDIAQDNLVQSFMRRHSGIEQAHKPGVLCEGAEWVDRGPVKPVDSQLTELREQEIIQHANWFSIPPHKLGSSKNVSYNSLEIEQQAYVDDAIAPHVAEITAACHDRIFSPEEREDPELFWYLDTDQLIRSPRKERYDANRVAIEGGWKTRQEVREEENMNELAGCEELVISNNVKGLPEEEDDVEVQKTALSGVQITSLLAVVQSITTGQVSPESGKAILAASFPTLTAQQINGIIDPLEISEDEPLNTSDGQNNPQQPVDDPEKPEQP